MNNQQQPPVKTFPVIHLIFSTADLSRPAEKALVERVASVDGTSQPGNSIVNWDLKDTQKVLGRIRFADHDIRVAGMAMPLPNPIIDQTIHVSHWPPQAKVAMRQHAAHMSLVYVGTNPDPIEKMIALYSVAHALKTENLLGIVNEGAWTAHPPADFLSPEKIRAFREEIPFILWVGYVKFFIDEHRYWLATKGHHIFDVPDLAYFVPSDEDSHQIINHFINIFHYMFEQDVVVTAGDTLEIGGTGQYMQFSEVTEYADFLMGPLGTLVIEKIDPDEINTVG